MTCDPELDLTATPPDEDNADDGEVDLTRFTVSKMIRHEGEHYVLYSSDGKRMLGKHKTMEEALAQERAIKANKKKKA